MYNLVFGTTNQAKINQIQGVLKSLDILVVGLPDSAKDVTIDENGKTAQENARKKALGYSRLLQRSVLSMDNALFFSGLQADQQPGIHVRRINKTEERPSDDDLLSYYSKLINSLGGKVDGRWEFALCYAYPNGSYEETTITSPRIFVGVPSTTIVPGYPLESIQIEPESGKYISEMTAEEQDRFWEKAIGRQVVRFIEFLRM